MRSTRCRELVVFALIGWGVIANSCKSESPSGEPEAGDVTTNSIGMKLVWLPAGEMSMGSPPEEPNRWDCENQVEVEITKPFLIGQTEVTQKQWQQVMKTTPWGEGERLLMPVKESPECAASFISWEQAVAFCDTLTQMERESKAMPPNAEYSLPTEAQWEYACRAGGTTPFSFWVLKPRDLQEDNKFGWWLLAFREKYPHEVASKLPNFWSLYDMHGNVEEWCQDWHGDKLQGGSDPKGPKTGENRVLRGGSWASTPDKCRSASRNGWPTKWSAGPWHGFRVVRVE